MLQLHGAGVEVDSPMIYDVIAAFPPLCAWLLLPSGVTPWSADDWHVFGFADILAAIAGISAWIETTGWEGVSVDIEKWFVGGHSNGGQGTWYTLLHHPDRVFAANPLSGYTSIENYVPYNFWHFAEPKKKAIVESARSSYRHELLAVNAKGISILQQHGSADDNVPTYHSRLMSQLLEGSGAGSVYHEVAGAGHWWDGVVTTDVLKDFYIEQIAKAHEPRDAVEEFEIVVANPADMGSKSGLRVLYLEESGEPGRVKARLVFTGIWIVETENLKAFEWDRKLLDETVVVDGSIVKIPLDQVPRGVELVTFWRSEEGVWSTKRLESSLRDTKHFGGIEAIMRTNGPVLVVAYGNNTFATALQVSRNLHNYFYADSTLLQVENGQSYTKAAFANLITMSIGANVPAHLCSPDFPISICSSYRIDDDQATASLSISARGRPLKTFSSGSEDAGAIYLRPLQDTFALELVIWGNNAKMLTQAARLAPTMTGIGAPDWIILQESAQLLGVHGCAIGFFNAQWDIGMSSFGFG
jgi:predicted esterase